MVAKVITVFNQKGGCGKTNVSMQLAGTLGLRGAKVMVIDLDSQGTATHWARQASDESPFPARVVGLAEMGEKAHREIKSHLADYDFIVVDCPPSVESPAASSAMLVSDLALMPVVPAPSDMWASKKAKSLAEHVKATNEDLIARMVPNMTQTVSNLARDTLEIIEEDEEVHATKAHLGFRTAYRECQLYGATVHALPHADKAIAEVDALADEVLALLGASVPAKRKEKSK